VFIIQLAMPRFQLLIAIALVVSVVTSVLTLYLTRSRKGKIQLPTTVADEQNERDVFDVIRPEDITVGYPIDAESFWKRVC
jgi:hypothetical protein